MRFGERVTVGPGGRVQIDRSDLPEGRTAEVIVLLDDAALPAAARPAPVAGIPRLSDLFGKAKGSFADAAETDPPPVPLTSLIGACAGQFASAEEADAYVRELRDEWDRP